jgi:hypothetical protein
MNAVELADADAMFVVVRAKSNLDVLKGNLRRRPPATTRLRERLRQFGEVRRHVFGAAATATRSSTNRKIPSRRLCEN